MSELAIVPPPTLLLPTYPLDEASTALGRALMSLANAQQVEWVSVAAGEYRSQLAVMEVRIRRLLVTVDRCRDDWGRARAAAWDAGQL